MSKTWFITGASRGFGREWALAALDRGDRVVATTRNVETLRGAYREYGDSLFGLSLDVTDRAAVFRAVREAHEHFGQIDIVVNNAGHGQFGMVEEITEREVRGQFEANFFGALWVTQAVLPYLRAQRSGHILQVSSGAGITAYRNVGAYAASKWALEGLSQSLALETADFGIRVTIIEPGRYSTEWGTVAKHATPMPEYDAVRDATARLRIQRQQNSGDPYATRNAVLRIVDAAEPPLRVIFGDGLLGIFEADYESRLAAWREWEPLSIAAHGGVSDS